MMYHIKSAIVIKDTNSLKSEFKDSHFFRKKWFTYIYWERRVI